MTRTDAQPTPSAAFFTEPGVTAPASAPAANASGAFLRVARYFHDCFAADARGGILKDIFEQTDYRVFASGTEQLLTASEARMSVPVKIGIEVHNAAEINRRERFLIYGSVFLVGKGQARGKNTGERFCAPLLYYPARIDLEGATAFVSASLDEQYVNFPLLSTFIDAESDEQAQAYAEAILAQVPTAPLQADSLRELASLVGELLPDLDTSSLSDFPTLLSEEELRAAMSGPMRLVCASAMVLAARPSEAKGVLTELQILGQQGDTSIPLAAIFDEAALPKNERGGDPNADQEPIFAAAELSLAQQNVVHHGRTRPLTLVIGPPGTGKSFTTAQLVLDAVARGQTVLITSKMNKAVDVVIEKLQPHLGSQTFILRGGDRNHREEMRGWLSGLLTNTGPQGMPQAARPGEIAMLEDRLRAADAELDRLDRAIAGVLNLELEWTEARGAVDAIETPNYDRSQAGALGPDEILRRYAEARKLGGNTAPLVGWAMQRRGQNQMEALCAALDLAEEQRGTIPSIAAKERERLRLLATERALEGQGDLNALFTAYARARDDRGRLVAELLAVRRRDALAQALRNDRRALMAFHTALKCEIRRRARRDLPRDGLPRPAAHLPDLGRDESARG
jgi:hypothetical protein